MLFYSILLYSILFILFIHKSVRMEQTFYSRAYLPWALLLLLFFLLTYFAIFFTLFILVIHIIYTLRSNKAKILLLHLCAEGLVSRTKYC